MKIWLSTDIVSRDAEDRIGGHHIGILVPHDAQMPTPDEGGLIAVQLGANTEKVPENTAAVLIPEGLNADPEVLGFAAALSNPIYLTVNGLGEGALKNSLNKVQGNDVVLLYDADAASDQAYLEQLAWLSSREFPFAISSESGGRLRVAAAFNPEALIVKTKLSIPLTELWGISKLCQRDALRPLSGEEIDEGLDKQLSLTVRCSLEAGKVISDDHLTVARTAESGLAPHLAPSVVGRSLRYAIQVGEPLTFGHFM